MKESSMTFSYISSLCLSNVKKDLPCDLESLIISFVKEAKVEDKARCLFKKVNSLLDLAPKIDDVERWENEAKEMKKAELQKGLDNELTSFGPMAWHLPLSLNPIGPSMEGKTGPFKKAMVIHYVNIMMYKNAWRKYEELLEDKMDIRHNWRPIYAPSGNLRVYSRHPIISQCAGWMEGLADTTDCRCPVADMVKSFYVNNQYDYKFAQGQSVFYILKDGVMYKR